MTKLVKIGPVYVNFDMVAAIDTENMTISINTGAGLEEIAFDYDQFDDEEAFAKEIEYITKTTIEEMYLNDLKNLRKEFVTEFPSDSNDTDKVKREKKVNVKTEEKEVKAPVKRKRRTKAEMEAARKKEEKQNKKKK